MDINILSENRRLLPGAYSTYKNPKSVVVVGGGAAGWLTALVLKKFTPTQKITLIESKEIGILGAGEGSVPLLATLLFDYLKLSPVEFYKKTNATFKYGISFENWNGDNEKFFLSFTTANWGKKIYSDASLDDTLVSNTAFNYFLNNRLSPFIKDEHTKQYRFQLPHSYHFDAHLLADFLKEEAIKRGIIHLEGKVINFEANEENCITNILLEGGQNVSCDFVYDCTGFKRLLIGKFYQTRWKSYSDRLPVKKALPFQLKINNNKFLTCTHAIALKHGWVWQIPLQNRYGCGYVFDSDYITPDQAKTEIEQHFGHEVTVPRIIDFNAGAYEKVCVKNCIAIGLSMGFTEPLEATSILLTILQLNFLRDGYNLRHIYSYDQKTIEKFNNYMNEVNESVVNFLHMHYLTDRKDSLFWQEFRVKNKTPKVVQNIIERNNGPADEKNLYPSNPYAVFGVESWKIVLNGLDLINKLPFQKEQIFKHAYEMVQQLPVLEPMDDLMSNLNSGWTINFTLK